MLSFHKSICIKRNHSKFGYRILRVFWNSRLLHTFYLWKIDISKKETKRRI